MSFENKVQVLMVLIEKYNAKMIQVNKSIKKDLINIIEERNILAHYPLDTTEIGLQEYYETNNLTFFKFKNIRANDGSGEISLTNSIIYNVSKTESLLNLINKYHLLITTAILDLHTVPPPAN